MPVIYGKETRGILYGESGQSLAAVAVMLNRTQ